MEKDTRGKKTDHFRKFICQVEDTYKPSGSWPLQESGYHWWRANQYNVTISPCQIAYSSSFHKHMHPLQSTSSAWAENEKNSTKVPSSRKSLSRGVVSVFGPSFLTQLHFLSTGSPNLPLCSLYWAWIKITRISPPSSMKKKKKSMDQFHACNSSMQCNEWGSS